MTLRFYALLDVDADKARANVQGLQRDTGNLTKGLTSLGGRAGLTSRELDALAAEARVAASSFDQVDAAATRARQGAMGMADSHTLAAGSVANLTAQFNDIGVMMAAGQNPFQLAIQQGTQITQVIGPMGATGAVKALGSAFLNMLSPVNLATIGVIAAGAALTQWAFSADEATGEADRFSEALEAIRQRAGAARDAVALFEAGVGSSEELAVKRRIGEIDAEIKALEAQLEGQGGQQLLNLQGQIAHRKEERDLIADQLRDLQAAESAADRLERIRAQADAAAKAYLERRAQAAAAEAEALALAEREAALANRMAEDLRNQALLQRTILTHGEDSVEVASLRRHQERLLFEEQLKTQIASEAWRDVIMEAYDTLDRSRSAAERLSRVMAEADASGLRDQVEEIARALGVSLDLALRIAQMGPQGATDPGAGRGRGADPRSHGGGVDDWRNRDAIVFLDHWEAPRKSRTDSAKAVKKERDAIKDLIAAKQLELEILRESDPLKQELLRHRETLAKATEAERAEIEKLIATHHRESEALQQASDQHDFFRQAAYSTLSDLTRGGAAAADAFSTLADMIHEAALQAVFLGEGPLAGILSVGGDGGLIGTLLGAAFPSAAAPVPANKDGGMFYAPGTSRGDQGLSWLSSGEFIVNASATARHRALLEMINSGTHLPRFANGGAVGGGTWGAPGVDIQIVNTSHAQIDQSYSEDQGPGGRRRLRFTLSDAVGEALTLPGGRARQTLRQGFDLAPVGTAR